MSTYTPDRWVVVELKSPEETLYKVLGSWYGGYLGSDSWRFSSGITKIQHKEYGYDIHNYSGSVYQCNAETYGMSTYTMSVYQSYEEQNSDEASIRALSEEEFKDLKLPS